MKKFKFTVVLLFVFGGIVVFLADRHTVNVVKSFSSGPPAGFTGGPGENSCSACHSGDVGNGQFAILSAPAVYQAGQTYAIQVRHVNANPTRLRWGFQLTAIDGSESGAGTFASLSPETQAISANGRSYIQQTLSGSAGGQTGGALWTFNWTAPLANVGPVTFYAAGNQANNDGRSDGDEIYLTSVTSSGTGGTPTPTATSTATPTATPTVTPTPQGFESDVAPRPNGDGSVLSGDVVQVRRFVVGLDSPNTTNSEYQRADSSPISTRGNGVVDATDTVQTRRYITGLDSLQSVGGPTAPIPAAGGEETLLDDFWRYFFGNEIRVREAVGKQGNALTIFVEIDGSNEWAAASFTLEFDGSVLTDPRVRLATEDSRETVVTVNDDHAEKGQLGILVDSASRTGNLAITFDIANDASGGETKIGFSDRLATRAVSDTFGGKIPARFEGGSITIK